MTSPSEFPPPVDSAAEFIGPPTDPEDERIEVGVAIVGGGQAGLACAIRLLQLLEDDPELTEKLGMPLEKVRKVLKIAKEPISTNTPVGDEEDATVGDFIEDKSALQPIDSAIQSDLRDTMAEVLATLTPREERVIRMRFGLGMTNDHTLEEVGQQFSVTRERIRQIEAKALRKLKHPSRSRKLRSFLDN